MKRLLVALLVSLVLLTGCRAPVSTPLSTSQISINPLPSPSLTVPFQSTSINPVPSQLSPNPSPLPTPTPTPTSALSTPHDILGIIRQSPNNATFNARFEVQVEKPSSVRLFLQIKSGAGTSKILMAEKVVRTENKWTHITGSRKVSWNGDLTEATINVEVAQIPEGFFPLFQVRNISIEPDDDNDLLSNMEEKLLGTNPALRDTDLDTMDDGWEIENGCNPLRDDSNMDADIDGFTNREEFWAATNPRDDASYPGKPSDSQATLVTKSILQYLALLPSHKEKRVIVGQHLTNVVPEYNGNINALQENTGKWVGLLALQYDDLTQIESVNSYAIDYWGRGGLVKIKYSLENPWTEKGRNDRPQKGEYNYIDIQGLLDPQKSRSKDMIEENQKAHDRYMGYLDTIAAGLKKLDDRGISVLWRPMSEMNGAWFWWGQSYRLDYIALWQHMHNYFTKVKGLHNLIWVYESDSSIHVQNPSDYYYPGDDFVDVMGHNFYNNTWDLPFDANALYRSYPKIYAFPQAGAGDIKDGSWDNMIFLDGIMKRYPRCSFFAAWNTYATQGGKVVVKRAIVDNLNAKQLMEHPWIVTREDLDWRK